MTSKPTQLGRPPASSSKETRKRIIDVARHSFAEFGYEATTNRVIAEGASITTGAIYHYFDSKLDIFKAVLVEVDELIQERVALAEASATTFLGQLEAVMEAFHQLNDEDASIAQFVGAARLDRRRLPGVRAARSGLDGGDRHFVRLIDNGIKTGEIDPADRESIRHLLRAIGIGLADGMSDDQTLHRHALNGLQLMLRGKLAPEN